MICKKLLLLSFSVAIECEVLPPIDDGSITYAEDTTPNFDLGTTATYECNEGFFLDVSVGNRVRTCVDDDGMDAIGVFDGTAPTCVRKYQSILSVGLIGHTLHV